MPLHHHCAAIQSSVANAVPVRRRASMAKGGDVRFGIFLRWLMWFEILFGWAASLMLVAVLGRLVE